MTIDRRRFLQGTAALFCAPAIVTEVMKIQVPEKRLVIEPLRPSYMLPDARTLNDMVNKKLCDATGIPAADMFQDQFRREVILGFENRQALTQAATDLACFGTGGYIVKVV